MAVSSKHTVVEEYLKISDFNSPYSLYSTLEDIGCTRLDRNNIESLIGYGVSSSGIVIYSSQELCRFSDDNPRFSTPVYMDTKLNRTVFSMDIEKNIYIYYGGERIEFLVSNLRTSTYRIIFECNGLGRYTVLCSYVDTRDLVMKGNKRGQDPFEPFGIDECVDRLNDYIVVP